MTATGDPRAERTPGTEARPGVGRIRPVTSPVALDDRWSRSGGPGSAAIVSGSLRLPIVSGSLRLLGAATLAAGVAGCADPDVPGRDPEVSGVVAGAGSAGGPVLAEPSDAYFEGMSLLRGDPVVVGVGDEMPPSDLRDGDEVEVWIEGGCAESFPVQCDVVAVRITG